MAKATRSSILTDQKYLGNEPVFDDNQLSTVGLIKTYNWYNYFKATEDAKKYLTDYCTSKKIKINISKHTDNTYGWLARMVSRGAILDELTSTKLDNYIQNIKRVKGDASSIQVEDRRVERVVNRLDEWIPDFEDAIDNFKSPFSAYNYLTTRNVPQVYAKQIQEKYIPVRDEVKSAYDKTDSDLIEAYKIHSRPELKAMLTLLNNIVSDCDIYLNNVKKERRPRKPRVKSVETILKHFKYQKTDDMLKISSEDPAKIIGASSLYVINTKYKTLTAFHAKESEGLTVNRTAIANYDETKSSTKRVGRRFDDVINAINTGTKRSRVKIMDSIKTDAIKLAERLNENCIIMRVDK